jgi:hypothetical protein
MFAFTPLNEEAYDKAAVRISYLKLFEHILEDFVTRQDSKQMMVPSNLPVQTTVQTIVNTAVQVVIPAGTGTGFGTGNGTGNGTASPIYTGDMPSPGSQLLKSKLLAEKEGSGAAVSATLGELGKK